MGEAFIFSVFGVLTAVVAAIFGSVILVGLYVLLGIGLSAMATRRGFYEKRYFAWIPFAQYYLIGLMVPELNLFNQKLTPMRVILPVAAVISCCGWIPVVGWLLPSAFYALVAYTSFQLMRDVTGENTLLYAIFWPIGYFLIRNK